jgi:signal recognition particle receptor subunit beta
MAQFNYNTREIIAKVVYYGPSFGGKTSSLQWLHTASDPKYIGTLFSLDTEADRTLFFDLLPINLGMINGMDLRLKIYTVPGQVKYNTTRKMVLAGADAVVFVADSTDGRHADNVESLNNLARNLAEKNLDIKTIPLVFQYNKRDLPETRSIETMNETLNFRNLPAFGSIAIDQNDQGVLESFLAVLHIMLQSFREKYDLDENNTGIQPMLAKVEQTFRNHVKEPSTVRIGMALRV